MYLSSIAANAASCVSLRHRTSARSAAGCSAGTPKVDAPQKRRQRRREATRKCLHRARQRCGSPRMKLSEPPLESVPPTRPCMPSCSASSISGRSASVELKRSRNAAPRWPVAADLVQYGRRTLPTRADAANDARCEYGACARRRRLHVERATAARLAAPWRRAVRARRNLARTVRRWRRCRRHRVATAQHAAFLAGASPPPRTPSTSTRRGPSCCHPRPEDLLGGPTVMPAAATSPEPTSSR